MRTCAYTHACAHSQLRVGFCLVRIFNGLIAMISPISKSIEYVFNVNYVPSRGRKTQKAGGDESIDQVLITHIVPRDGAVAGKLWVGGIRKSFMEVSLGLQGDLGPDLGGG